MTTDAPTLGETLLEEAKIPFERDVDLGPLTWYGVGGRARYLSHPRDLGQLTDLAGVCHRTGMKLRVLGKGANLLVASAAVEGIVVVLDALWFKRLEPDVERAILTAGGGADLEKAIITAVRVGLEGLEVLAGIPATIGGALRMNAGGAFGQIADCVGEVTVVEPSGQIRTMARADLDFGYRRSGLGASIVAEARFTLRKASDPAALRQRLKDVMRYKQETQPMADHSAGCAFKNPPKEISPKGAGQLIDEAGLKGFRVGGAEVSPVHANFIVAGPGARAADVLALMDLVRKRVKEHVGVELEREVMVWADHE